MKKEQRRLTFQALDVSCRQCVIDIRQLLKGQIGVIDIKVNEMLNIFYIDYDPDKISENNLETLIKKIGYTIVKLRSVKDIH